MTDIVRVLRIIEYVGPRGWVEKTVAKSITRRDIAKDCYIQGATLTAYPEVLNVEKS